MPNSSDILCCLIRPTFCLQHAALILQSFVVNTTISAQSPNYLSSISKCVLPHTNYLTSTISYLSYTSKLSLIHPKVIYHTPPNYLSSTSNYLSYTSKLSLIHLQLSLIHHKIISHPPPNNLSSTTKLSFIHLQSISHPPPNYLSSTSKVSLIHLQIISHPPPLIYLSSLCKYSLDTLKRNTF